MRGTAASASSGSRPAPVRALRTWAWLTSWACRLRSACAAAVASARPRPMPPWAMLAPSDIRVSGWGTRLCSGRLCAALAVTSWACAGLKSRPGIWPAILDLAQHVDGLPQPLACVGVAELGHPPFLEVARLERREGLLQKLVSQELLGARVPRQVGSAPGVGRKLFGAHASDRLSQGNSQELSRNTCAQAVAKAPTTRSSLSSSASA